MTSDVNDFLMGSGGRSASFKNEKDMVWGDVVHSEVRQQTDFDSGELLFWNDGKPRLQLVISLQTEEQDDEEDDGVRKVYAKGNMLKAIRAAIAKAGARGIENGGKLAVQYVGDGPKPPRGFPPKLYGAKYEPPVYSTALPDDPGDEPPPLDDEFAPF
jgi:hypothetical protein